MTTAIVDNDKIQVTYLKELSAPQQYEYYVSDRCPANDKYIGQVAESKKMSKFVAKSQVLWSTSSLFTRSL